MGKKLLRLLLSDAPDLTFRSSFIMLFPTLATDDPGVTRLSDWAQENILTLWHTSSWYLSLWEPKSSAGWSPTSSFQENQFGSFEPNFVTSNKYHLSTLIIVQHWSSHTMHIFLLQAANYIPTAINTVCSLVPSLEKCQVHLSCLNLH